MTKVDVCVVGAGLIGLSVARALVDAYPGIDIVVLDKEGRVATHQSSHNSGVIHSGLYYRPGSLKARLCQEGRRAMYALCEREGLPFHRSGKLVIATDPEERGALEELERRGRANGLQGLERLGPAGILDYEPHAVGVEALHVPEAGVADFPAVAETIAGGLITAGAQLLTGQPVTAIRRHVSGVEIATDDARIEASVLVNCAGLHADRIAAMAGVEAGVRLIPFRGEYWRLTDVAAGLVNALIYPVPDPRFPFLGVHFTRRVDGVVEVGPNAIVALGREHYRGVSPDWGDVWDAVTSPGFGRLALRHWAPGFQELVRSRSRRMYARQARRLVPALEAAQLEPGGAGVRAQAVDRRGVLVDDFVIERAGSTLHVLNAPSPGATACLAIGKYIAEEARSLFSG